jgi:hypothetical protein
MQLSKGAWASRWCRWLRLAARRVCSTARATALHALGPQWLKAGCGLSAGARRHRLLLL